MKTVANSPFFFFFFLQSICNAELIEMSDVLIKSPAYFGHENIICCLFSKQVPL